MELASSAWSGFQALTADQVSTMAGNHRDKGSTSFATIGATLVPTVITAAVYLIIFVFIRPRYPNIYSPRTYFRTIPDKDRTPTTRPGSRSWYHDFLWLDDRFVLTHHSLDAYLFLRYLRVIIFACFVGCVLTWPILFPVNITGGGTATQLDRLSFSNAVGKNRLFAHALVAWLLVAFMLLLITRERLFLIGLKQAYFTTKSHAFRLSSRVVLFLAVPPSALSEQNLQHYFGPQAKRCWAIPKIRDLEDLVSKRNDNITDLENAEIKLEQNVNSHPQQQNNSSEADNGTSANETGEDNITPRTRPKKRTFPLFGKQVDAIDLHLDKLPGLIDDLEKARESLSSRKHRHPGAIFVEFQDQASAHQAYQSIRHHSPLAMQPRYIAMQPKEVLWPNIHMNSTVRIGWNYIQIAFFAAMIIFWTIPIGLIGTLSNVKYLADHYSWLRWINNLPDPILGLLEGFLPPYLLSSVVSYVPKFMRKISRLESPTTGSAEMRVQIWYFVFQVIQVFLVTTFTSGAAAVATQIIDNPKIVPQLLADNIPKASNFYLSYFILQGTASAASNILNYSDLLEYLFYDRVFDNTPREKYERLAFMKGCSQGSVFPKFTNFVVIAMAYACIQPLVLGFATAGIFLYYISYRYNLLYTLQTKIDTKGACYALALQHLMTGVYLLELCLLGLLSARKASGPSTLVLVLFFATIIYHITVNKLLCPLEEYIPIDVLSTPKADEQPLLSTEDSEANTDGESHRHHLLIPGAATDKKLSTIGGKLPTILLDPLATLIGSRVLHSYESLRPWLDGEYDRTSSTTENTEEVAPPEYTEEELKTAYLHPAMTSKPPKIWLPKDNNHVSKWAIEKNKTVKGLQTSDEGAELTGAGHVKWDKSDLSKAPIFKKPKTW